MSSKIVRIGTRASPLAMLQASYVAKIIKSKLFLDCELIPIITSGDKAKNVVLYDIGGKGLFIKELEEALLSKEIDLAVHSLKDVPGMIPKGFQIAAMLEREDARDTLVSNHGYDIRNLPIGANVGTSSSRRRLQILSIRPDLNIVPCRGNIETRIKQIDDKNLSAIILANVGLTRLGVKAKSSIISTQDMIPAAGQGVISVEILSDNKFAAEICREINHISTWKLLQAERAFLEALNADCRTPIAAYARFNEANNNIVNASYMFADFHGKYNLKEEKSFAIEDGYTTSLAVAKNFLTRISLLK